eukprot:CAMPEP_0185600334 /NCGR_PEP_ID=MMETSP0436-20130131/345_1 /TAXON_ID=626734 ORGANISM="Favella taraikaensis, Strain Fe Narragansett Bay" /NCGR_SAMPLE_ID=MMETSP0436 /ASSEMBLY_ACC=CAM_ASM_000390 /LENGTH=261 /DNA_ID=CAMNT_0028230013 /DNA_START=128 /DNA_END=911 /DNA_ORIENTATION=-
MILELSSGQPPELATERATLLNALFAAVLTTAATATAATTATTAGALTVALTVTTAADALAITTAALTGTTAFAEEAVFAETTATKTTGGARFDRLVVSDEPVEGLRGSASGEGAAVDGGASGVVEADVLADVSGQIHGRGRVAPQATVGAVAGSEVTTELGSGVGLESEGVDSAGGEAKPLGLVLNGRAFSAGLREEDSANDIGVGVSGRLIVAVSEGVSEAGEESYTSSTSASASAAGLSGAGKNGGEHSGSECESHLF